MGGRKVTGSLRNQLEDFWGRSTDKKFHQIEGIVSSPHFDSIWWLGLKGQFLDTQKLLAYSSQNRYLVDANVTPNFHCGKRPSSTGVHNADLKMRLQNTSPDAQNQVACFNFIIPRTANNGGMHEINNHFLTPCYQHQ